MFDYERRLQARQNEARRDSGLRDAIAEILNAPHDYRPSAPEPDDTGCARCHRARAFHPDYMAAERGEGTDR